MRAVIRELFETIILALLIFLLLHMSVQNYRVQGPSMRPTLTEGEYVLVNKLVYMRFDPQTLRNLIPFIDAASDNKEDDSVYPFHGPARGEVIIFKFPRDETRDFVKRVIGLPGETVEIERGRVRVNGEELDEPYLTQRDNSDMGPLEIGPDEYFVIGDNRRASNDSRDWGTVPAENIVGRAWVSFWPLDKWHGLMASFGR